MTLAERFSKAIKTGRESKKLSQSELAEMTDVTTANISCLESAKTAPTLETALLVADCLGISLDEFKKTAKADRIASLEKKLNKLRGNV